jgi:hypothetical protein
MNYSLIPKNKIIKSNFLYGNNLCKWWNKTTFKSIISYLSMLNGTIENQFVIKSTKNITFFKNMKINKYQIMSIVN